MMDNATITVSPPPEEMDLEEYFNSLERVSDARASISRTQESTVFTPADNLPVGIAFTSDWHVGAGGVDYSRLREDLDLIRETDGLYAVHLGDLIENTKPQGKSGPALWGALFPNPDDQIRYLVSRMRMISGKWVAICQGNHDAFDGRWAGIDRLPALADDLGCPYFTERGGTIIVDHGGQRYVVVVKHNWRGNSGVNKSNAQRRVWDEWPWEWQSADVVVLGHTHEPLVETVQRRGQPVAYIRCGTYKVKDDYGERLGYRAGYGVPVVIFWPGERKFIPFPGERFHEAVALLASVREAVRD
jgi:predicted phosphodiesterase